MAFGRILELRRYPVSSLGGERLEAAMLESGEPGGIVGDRLWGLVAEDDGEIAKPEKRRRWRPVPELHGRSAAGGVEVGRDGGPWHPVGSAGAAALASGHLGFAVGFRPHGGSEGQGAVAPRYQRADLHLLTTASLRHLAGLLPPTARLEPPRFRPNLLVETGEAEGFVEAGLVGRSLTVGTARVTVVEPCKRCAFTTLAQGDLPLDPAILQAIARAGGGSFGVLCRVEQGGALAVGDPVTLSAA
ncbi:hypothetical protein SAMN06265365_14341 [Tistlia consotensis]|uniref:MOSC domain-containing protein n=1 Tax=Tistlia consotensis USBA 355 TaxID=560819 RepID=A0A1Y6BC56_9PROT|nr:MOSC domain-containing protein [Tistlia consotensis]SMF02395.1 hypothetical protein SAMN05428998_10350 [Tistlia consotensis USBA 355]SNS26874.1 hypothetical protein SAMN06265365_14341 [Tistlia consotensis]